MKHYVVRNQPWEVGVKNKRVTGVKSCDESYKNTERHVRLWRDNTHHTKSRRFVVVDLLSN